MSPYAIVADAISALHLAYIFYVIFGQLAILIGWPLRWQWIRNPWFRITHLTMIVIVAVEALFDIECPLTTWELKLRVYAGQLDPDFRRLRGAWELDDMSFIGRLVRDLFVFDNKWGDVISYAYYAFAGLVLTTAMLVPFRLSKRADGKGPSWPRACRAVTATTLAICSLAALATFFFFALVVVRSGHFGWAHLLTYGLWDALPYVAMGLCARYWREHFAASVLSLCEVILLCPVGLYLLHEAFGVYMVPPPPPPGVTPDPIHFESPQAETMVPVIQLGLLAVLQSLVFGIAWLEGSLPGPSASADLSFDRNAHEAISLDSLDADA